MVSTMTFEPLLDGRQIAEAVRRLAAVCDGAVEDDGRGFNGTDAPFGHRLAALPLERWTPGNMAAAHKMLAKYRKQLASLGVSFDALPAPPQEAVQQATRRTWRQQDSCRLWLDTEGYYGRQFCMAFPYDVDMVNAARTIPGRRWEGSAKMNTFPLDAATAIRTFMADSNREWEVSEDAQAVLDEHANVEPEPSEAPLIGSVSLDEKDFIVRMYEYVPAMVDELRLIPGRRWEPVKLANVIPERSSEFLRAFLIAHPEFEVDEDVQGRMVELREREASREATSAALFEMSRAHDAELQIDGLGGEMRPFQRAGVAYVEAADGRAFICDEQGTGKTVQALALIHNRDAYPAVVVAPASVKTSWRDHVQGPPRWTPRHPIPENGWLPEATVVVLSGRKPDPMLIEWIREQPKVIVALNWDILDAWEPLLSDLRPKALVFDECHYAKEVRAKRTKAALELGKHAAKGALKLCMSGTSVVNRPKELIAQLRLIDRLQDLGGSKEFRDRYCDTYWDGYRWNDKGASHLEELNRRLRETCFIRRTKAEVMTELEPKQIVRVPVTLDNPREYDRAEQETIKFLMEQVEKDKQVREEIEALPVHERAAAMRARMNDKAERARSAEKIVRMNLLRKVCAEGKIRAAVAWAQEFMDSTESKLIVFAHHRDVQAALLAAAPESARVFGEDSSAKRTLAIERFQTDPGCRQIVCSLRAAREGITLTAASDVATVELDWTPATHDQAEDRAHRMGQRDSVTCYYLLAEGTIDDDMHELIEGKREVTSATMDGEAKRREMTTSIMGALEERLLAKGLKR